MFEGIPIMKIEGRTVGRGCAEDRRFLSPCLDFGAGLYREVRRTRLGASRDLSSCVICQTNLLTSR
jgi:hypothetical protein